MLYLIRPEGRLQWNDLPAALVLNAARANGADLSGLDWLNAERDQAPDIVRSGLRHGVPCRAGIAIDAAHVIDLDRADEIRRLHAQAAQNRHREANGAFMERLMPGWGEHGRKLDAQIAEGGERAAREAEEDAKETLSAPVRPELVEHWRSLGGFLPHPM